MVESKKLKDISLSIGSGITPRRDNKSYWENGTIPWLKTEQLGEKNIYDTNEKISQIALDETSIKLFPVNTLSMAMYGEGRTRGNVSILKKAMTTNQACCNIVIDSKKADYEFVYYYLKTQYEQLRGLSSGVRKNLNSNDIKEYEIRLPSDISTQQKIAAVLSALDAKIELNARINAELESMAKTLYDYWFVQFKTPSLPPPNTTDDPPSYLGEVPAIAGGGGGLVWNEALKREIPLGWDVDNIMRLGDLLGGGTPKTSEPSYWGGNIPFFTPKDTNDSIFVLNTLDYITEAGLESCSSRLYPKGTIFITARGTVGKINVASQEMAMNQSCYALQAKPEINYYFLHQHSVHLVQYLKAKSNGSIFDAIVSNDIKLTPIVIPPLPLIQKFGEHTKGLYEKILVNKQESQTLTELRDWLLPMLMNGQVKVS